MTPDFYVLHRKGPERFVLPEEAGSHFSFMTCLRHIVIADLDEMGHLATQATGLNDQILRGEAAYQLLLEIICGLHSSLVGETEVAGQFKNAVNQFTVPATPWGTLLAKTFKALFEDAKKIRDQHLKDLGSQSYGSVLRREVKGLKNVHILGAGHLVQEILPWINKDGIKIVIHARDTEKALKDLGPLSKNAVVSAIDARFELTDVDAMVVAAPVSAGWMKNWMPEGSQAKLIADLRSDSSTDALIDFDHVLELNEFMGRLSQNQAFIQERKVAALAAVSRAASDRARTVEYRPFGWEDVCA